MPKKENLNFEKYVELRIKVRDSHYLQWEILNEEILVLIQKTEDLTPEIIDDIKDAYDYLSQAVILSIFPTDFPPPKNFNELQTEELPLLYNIPEALRKLFHKLFKAFLKISDHNYLEPDENLYHLLTKFNIENVELRYPVSKESKNPYLKGKSERDWKKRAIHEFCSYYDGIFDLITSIRNFETHREDAFTSAQFDLARRKVAEPISGIASPGNYLVLSGLVILCVYAFIEILRRWIDTQVRLR